MTETELRNLERLCKNFSSLTEENKEFTLDVSQALLTVQGPAVVLPFHQEGRGSKRTMPSPWPKRQDERENK
jgi:hypothetical protein